MSKVKPLPGFPDWEAWTTRDVNNVITWHARPVGSPNAVAHGATLPGLVMTANQWVTRPVEAINARIVELRERLDMLPESCIQEREHVTALMDIELAVLKRGVS